ncbi:MAG TPA: ABC transporter permease [Bauldia sp.]|nr:ABC transporter permease [Bauldia sp.]
MNLDLLARYGPRMLEGLLVTLELVAISVTIGGLLAIPLALGRLSRSRLLRGATFAYTYFFRGTPLLAQLFLLYYGAGEFRAELEAAGLWWIFRDAFFCAVLTFTLNTAAYQAEILRGAIRAVPNGQTEAAMSLGLHRGVAFLKVVLPQALIIALRPLGNEVVLMVKGSAVASIVTVFDLMGATRLAFARSFDITVYFWAAILYLVVVETLRRVWDALERRLTRHLRPSGT